MLMSQGEDLNQFQTYAKDATKVNLLQRGYKHICATSESEARREIQQQPKEQNCSSVERREKLGGKLGKEEEVEIISSSPAMVALNLNSLIHRMTQVLMS